jgi:hypothetical protein
MFLKDCDFRLGFNLVTSGIMLKIDQPPIALIHTLCGKEWKETKLKERRIPTM